MMEPMVNQKALRRLNWFSSSWGSSMHGYGLFHSYGLILMGEGQRRRYHLQALAPADSGVGNQRVCMARVPGGRVYLTGAPLTEP